MKKKVERKDRLEFPDVTDADMAFGRYPEDWFKKVMEIPEAEDDRKWNELAEKLFFEGGKIPLNTTLDKEYLTKGSRILRAVLGSFTPKHQHKEKVCGLILKSLCS